MCYAETLATRWKYDVWGPKSAVRRTFGASHWAQPLSWNRAAMAEGKRRRVFCSSMCDVFEDHPTIAAEREKLWPLIRATPWLDWQILTKRADRIEANLPPGWGAGWDNVWLGVSVENQRMVERAAILAQIPAAVRFVSCEPLLGPVSLAAKAFYRHAQREIPILTHLDWVIVGGESGPDYRPMDLDWAEALRMECAAAKVPFFFKQTDGPAPGSLAGVPPLLNIQQLPLGLAV